MATYERIDYGSPDGAQFGGASTDLIAFHGATPTDQYAVVATVSVTFTATGGGAFDSTDQASTLVAAVNSILALLKEKGLMASS